MEWYLEFQSGSSGDDQVDAGQSSSEVVYRSIDRELTTAGLGDRKVKHHHPPVI
jgi:hypothetical protein